MYYPALLVFASIVLLIVNYKHTKIFNLLAIIYPLFAGAAILSCSGKPRVWLLNTEFIIDCAGMNKLICLGFVIVTLAANLYALGQNQKKEIIIGGIYAGSSIMCIFAGDFISLFASLELMMLASTLLILLGGTRQSIIAARQYFLTHLISGSLLLIGICYVIAKTGNSEIISLTELIRSRDQGFLIYALMFTGCLINVASFPFSGWMVNCYPYASSSSLIFLVNFTTKVSVVILIKLFSGFEGLKFFGILMIFYAGYNACIENNIRRLLCYLSISQLGFMLIGISIGTEAALAGTVVYLFIHIFYKCALTLCSVTLSDEASIFNCSSLRRLKNPLINFTLVIVIGVMAAIPYTTGLYGKFMVTGLLGNDLSYYAIICLNIFLFVNLPVAQYFSEKEAIGFNQNIFAKSSLILMNVVLVIASLCPKILEYVFPSFTIETGLGISNIIKQLLILMVAGVVFYITKNFKTHNQNTIVMNFNLLAAIENSFSHLFLNARRRIKEKNNFIDLSIFGELERKIINKLALLHTQNTSIFVVFILLIILLLILQNS